MEAAHLTELLPRPDVEHLAVLEDGARELADALLRVAIRLQRELHFPFLSALRHSIELEHLGRTTTQAHALRRRVRPATRAGGGCRFQVHGDAPALRRLRGGRWKGWRP